MDDENLYKLYEAETIAYGKYRVVVEESTRRPALVKAARRLWLSALTRLQDEATWPEVRAMLERRQGEPKATIRSRG